VAEGGSLLNCCTLSRCTEGSNPSVSADSRPQASDKPPVCFGCAEPEALLARVDACKDRSGHP
jgi:hypothetical protein